MRSKGNIIELVISLLLIFIIASDLMILCDFNFKVIKKTKFKYEEKILQNNLINILKRDLYFNNKNKYFLEKKENKYFIRTNKNLYYLGYFRYFKLNHLEMISKKLILDNIEIGEIKYIRLEINGKVKYFLLEE